jgi:hypothetical protein
MLGVYVSLAPGPHDGARPAGLRVGRPPERPWHPPPSAARLERATGQPIEEVPRPALPDESVQATARAAEGTDSPAADAATECGFSACEREFLLLQRGIGPGVIAQLERRGVHTMNALVRWVGSGPGDDGAPVLVSSRNALSRAVEAWAAREPTTRRPVGHRHGARAVHPCAGVVAARGASRATGA